MARTSITLKDNSQFYIDHLDDQIIRKNELLFIRCHLKNNIVVSKYYNNIDVALSDNLKKSILFVCIHFKYDDNICREYRLIRDNRALNFITQNTKGYYLNDWKKNLTLSIKSIEFLFHNYFALEIKYTDTHSRFNEPQIIKIDNYTKASKSEWARIATPDANIVQQLFIFFKLFEENKIRHKASLKIEEILTYFESNKNKFDISESIPLSKDLKKCLEHFL